MGLPHSRPMPSVGPRCHELWITDVSSIWRIMYRIDPDAVIVIDVFCKKTQTTPKAVIDRCRKRLRAWDSD